jgi:hypothetical protein
MQQCTMGLANWSEVGKLTDNAFIGTSFVVYHGLSQRSIPVFGTTAWRRRCVRGLRLDTCVY